MVLDNAAGHQCGAVGIAGGSRQARLTPETARACSMQLTISNVGNRGTMNNEGLQNTIEVLDMVLDNAAGHQCGAVGIAGGSQQARVTPKTARVCSMQLTISNVAAWSTMKNGGLENII
jgi:hypothetical protein